MSELALIAGFVVCLALWAAWTRTRSRRSRARLRRLYAQRELTASVLSAVDPSPSVTAVVRDDRQMNLFTDVPRVQPLPALRRRPDGQTSERLDWQYFNKDSGDLAYPEAKDRRRPGSVEPVTPASVPQRRA